MKKNINMCEGCRDDFYNGKNGGIEKCWSYETCLVESKKRVHINDIPPWKQKPEQVLSCYHAEQYVFVEGHREY